MDANTLITNWNTSTDAASITLSASVAKATLNDSVQLTATVTAATGTGTPTGTVNFNFETVPLGSATLSGGTATVTAPLYLIQQPAPAQPPVSAEYSGDGSFSPGGATKTIQITAPTGGVTSIIPSAPTTVWPQPADAQGLTWQTTISLSEVAGVPAIITGLTIDGVGQTLSQVFPSPQIAPKTTVNASFTFRNLAAPLIRTFVFTGTDPTGAVWTRQVAVNYRRPSHLQLLQPDATPLVAVQGPSNTCPWSVQLNVDDLGGFGVNTITALDSGNVSFTSRIPSIFGTRRLDAFGGLQGTLCFSGITPPATDAIYVALSDGANYNLNVSFAGPPANPGTLAALPVNLSLAGPVAPPGAAPVKPPSATLNVTLSDKTQTWTAAHLSRQSHHIVAQRLATVRHRQRERSLSTANGVPDSSPASTAPP